MTCRPAIPILAALLPGLSFLISAVSGQMIAEEDLPSSGLLIY